MSSVDDKCISEGLSDCKGCNGLQYECIGYIPKVQGEMYEATKIDRVTEAYQKIKETLMRKLQ